MKKVILHKLCMFCANDGNIKRSEEYLNRNPLGIMQISLEVNLKKDGEPIHCYQCRNHIIELNKDFKLTSSWKNKIKRLFGKGKYQLKSGVFKLKFKPKKHEERYLIKFCKNMNILALEGLPNGIEFEC